MYSRLHVEKRKGLRLDGQKGAWDTKACFWYRDYITSNLNGTERIIWRGVSSFSRLSSSEVVGVKSVIFLLLEVQPIQSKRLIISFSDLRPHISFWKTHIIVISLLLELVPSQYRKLDEQNHLTGPSSTYGGSIYHLLTATVGKRKRWRRTAFGILAPTHKSSREGSGKGVQKFISMWPATH